MVGDLQMCGLPLLIWLRQKIFVGPQDIDNATFEPCDGYA